MTSKKILQALFLLSLFFIHCSPPRQSAAAPAKPSDPNDVLAKIKMTDLDGKALDLKAYAGKPIFLNFWATWCGPCHSEMPSVEKASKQFKDQITFLALSNESPSLIKSYVKKNKLTFNFAKLEGTYLDVYVLVLPTTLLIDANGKVVEEEEGYRDWASASSIEKLEALVKK